MIEYDYLLKRDEGDCIQPYKPDKIPQRLSNIVYIEGPNSIGKSTLLNIIALSMHGLRNKKLNPALSNKLNGLVNSSHQKIYFNIKINNRDNSIELISEKQENSNDIILREYKNNKSRILTPELFEREYNLIYDIPDNPTERLKLLTKDIKDIQNNYGKKVKDVREGILSIINEIKNARDPEKIEELRNNIKKCELEKTNLSQQKIFTLSILDNLEKYAYINYYIYYKDQCSYIQTIIETLDKQVKKIEKKEKKIDQQKEIMFDNLKREVYDLKNNYEESTKLLNILTPPEFKNHLEVWNRFNFEYILIDYELEDKLKQEIEYFDTILNKLVNDENINKSLNELEIYKKLIELLDNYNNYTIILPGTDKPISEFLKALRKSYDDYEQLRNYSNNINDAKNYLLKLENNRTHINNYIAILKKYKSNSTSNNDDPISENNVNKQIDELKLKHKTFEKKFQDYYVKCKNKNLDTENLDSLNFIINEISSISELAPYLKITEEQILHKIKDLNDDLSAHNKSIQSYENYIEMYNKDLKKLEDKEPHKYQNKLKELNYLFNITRALESKLNKDFENYILSIIKNDKKSIKINNTDQEKEYNLYLDEVSKFLGKKVGFIRHINNDYKVNKIDMFTNTIYAENKVIMLNDMGTGQSQSAYLRGLLNVNDNRKIIALFDEVAMMDSKSLEPIYEKFQELFEQNKLLIGIVVQKSDNIKIESMI